MADEKTQFWILGALVAAVTGLYSFFIKHLIGHADRAETGDEIQQLWDKKQSTANCDQIVKRIDERLASNHRQITEKLDRLLDYQERGGPKGR